MYKIVTLEEILQVLKSTDKKDIIKSIEEGFVAFSRGEVVVPPVGEMLFKEQDGEAHIKYGFIKEDDYYVIKIASGFYKNRELGLSPNSGLMLMFSQKTGEIVGILLDEGHLTNIRTAAAGAVVAKQLAPSTIKQIGIIGAGYQGQLQLEYLGAVTDCREVMVWGISDEELETYVSKLSPKGFNIKTTRQTSEIAASCNLIITATPSDKPLLKAEEITKGTHITAVGSDTEHKIELDPAILGIADVVVADSMDQSQLRGEIFQARKAGMIVDKDVVELGKVIDKKSPGRTHDEQITVADLTGVAVQDIQICKAVYNALA
jgi:ornithine cyclodeaminase/alanine dehydrogenase-like protein (mu-crystallin family)